MTNILGDYFPECVLGGTSVFSKIIYCMIMWIYGIAKNIKRSFLLKEEVNKRFVSSHNVMSRISVLEILCLL